MPAREGGARRVVLVTGSSAGIGWTVAQKFVQAGDRVAMNGRRPDVLDAAVGRIRGGERAPLAIPGDVGRVDDVRGMFDAVERELGRVGVLVNCAGGGHGARHLHELATEDLLAVIQVDLIGTLLCCREMVRRMAPEGGAIVNVSSQAGRAASELAGPHYAAAKAGVIGLTRQLARDYGPAGLRANTVAPGITLVDRIRGKLDRRSADDRARMLEAIPLGRFAEPDDIARVVLFLASDEASYITGATIDVNGGRFTS